MKLTDGQEFTMKVAKEGYESYCRYTDWKNVVSGEALPKWEDLPGDIKNAWFATADGMIEFLASFKDNIIIIEE